MSDIEKLIEFLKGKISDDDIAEVVMIVNGGTDPQDPGMDEPPPFRGQPLTGGSKAQDAALQRRVTDAFARQGRQVRRAYDQHRNSLGLRPIRNLG